MRISITTKKRHLLYATGDDAAALEVAAAASGEWVTLDGEFEVASDGGDMTVYEDDESRYDRDVPEGRARQGDAFGFVAT